MNKDIYRVRWTHVTPENVSYDAVVLQEAHFLFWPSIETQLSSLFLYLTACSRRRGMQVSLQDTP